MTLLNAWTHGKRGYLATDTAILDIAQGGKAIGFGSKVFHGADWPALVGVSFIGGAIEWVVEAFALTPPKNIKGLQRAMSAACGHAVAKSKEHGAPNAEYRLLAVAWCARARKPRIFMCSSCDEAAHGFGAPHEVVELDFFFSNGVETDEVQDAMQRLKKGQDIDASNLWEAQRCARFDRGDTGASYDHVPVGGKGAP